MKPTTIKPTTFSQFYSSQGLLANARVSSMGKALLTSALLMGWTVGSVEAQIIYSQDFNAPGATAASVGWTSGFGYSGENSYANIVTNTGVGGSGALVTTVNVTSGSTLGAFAEHYSQSIVFPAGASFANISLTADVTGNVTGAPFSFQIQDDGSHYITFNSTVGSAGTYQSVGGLLNTANGVNPAFNFAASFYKFDLGFNSSSLWVNGLDSLTIDNVVLQTIAPPSSLVPFPLTIAKQGGGSLVLTWPGVVGHNYAVQVKGALNEAQWFNLASPMTATATTTSYTNNLTSGASQFYRIVSE
jgi:hypothetical protein